MTNQLEGEALSKAVAEVYGVSEGYITSAMYSSEGTIWEAPIFWLHEDSGRCFELAIKYRIGLDLNYLDFAKLNQANNLSLDQEIQSVRTMILRRLLVMKS